MDSRLNYSVIVKDVLQRYVAYYSADDASVLQTVFDESAQRYLLLDVGWDGASYIHQVLVHIELLDNRVWIQFDDTEEGVATALLQKGVPSTDIVLGFRHPKMRVYTEFAVG